MSNKITLNLNQSPYYDDFDENKNFHQILYKPALPVQARELTQQQSILRNQIKNFGDHIFRNGSKVTGADFVLNLDYEYVKLQQQFNSVDIDVTLFTGKTVIGSQSGTKAIVLNTVAIDATLSEPDTIFVKYITGGSVTQAVQAINITAGGTGYTTVPTVTITSGGGTGATATAVISSGSVIGIDIDTKGTNYTTTPTVTITGGGGTGASGAATLLTAATFLGGERVSATDGSVSATANATSPTGKGSSVSVEEGVFYISGNFIKIAKQTLILEKFSNTPSYKTGISVAETVVDSGEDSTLLDNAQGSFNFAAPGSDRLKLVLTLAKKTLTSTDDLDFYEILRVNAGIKEKDIKIPIYSVLEETFARRTYDESGSYTVRAFNIQLKDHPSDATKFIVRLDPGKAFIEGFEFETIVSTDITLDRARDFVDVNNFDRLMQYGNFVVTKDYNGLFDITTHATVDLHNAAHASVSLLSPTNYSATKIGTAKVRNIDYVSGTGATQIINMYLYDVVMTSSAFSAVECITIPNSTYLTASTVSSITITAGGSSYSSAPTVTFSGGGGTGAAGTAVLSSNAVASVSITNAGTGYTSVPTVAFSSGGGTGAAGTVVLNPVGITSKCNIDDTGKVGGVSGGDAKLFETSENSLVFKLPQDTIKTIRDSTSVIDTSYQIKRVFENVTFTSGVATISTASSTETFTGTGALSDTNKREFYTTTVLTAGNSGLAVGAQVAFDTSGQTVTVNGPSNTTITFNDNTGSANFTADIIATINIDSKQERAKTIVKSNVLDVTGPNTTALAYDSIAKADVYKLHAVYDSGAGGTNATLPTLTVTSAAGDLTAGETITGGTSGATGIVIVGAASTTTVTYVVVSGTFVAETITGGTSSVTKTVTSVAAGSTDLTSRYELDTGQRDNFYDHGGIKLKAGQTGPTGRIAIVYDYFAHAGVGYLSVDSYVTAIGFDNVPIYTSPVTGEKVELRDCVDFRPRRADSAATIENIELPIPNTNWSADYSYYLPRTDTVFLSRERNFGTNKGISSLNLVPPSRLNGTMDLFTIYLPAYTFNSSDVTTQYIENKRYTMRDIGKIEKRLSNVEYYTSLSLLEKEADALTIKDTAGLDRFKNGILVDNFNGHSVGNVLSPDYKCAIDFDEKILRPSFNSNITDLIFNTASSAGVQKTGDCVTLPYTTTALVDQSVASKAINVNPFAVLAWVGTVDLTPPNDNWIDTTTNPEVIVNIQGENDAWESLVGLSWGTQFNDWQTVVTGRETVLASSNSIERAGRGWPIRRRTTETVEATVTQSRSGIRNEITGTDTVRNSIGDRIVDVSIVPFIRARNITIQVRGMKPNTRVYPFFDSESVAAYCTPSGGTIGDAIYTDDAGSIDGLVFAIPSSTTLRFRTGERQFLLVDNTVGDLVTASTYGEVIYQAQGLLQTKENVVVASRVPRVQSFGQGSATDFRTTTNIFNRVNVGGWFDPLAETFLIDETLYPDGVFISDIDLYFKSKDDNGLPVSLQIRDTLNGYPAQTILPFSDVSLLPTEVNISEDATTATKFTFPSLVYLQPGEYAMVVLSNSLKYEAYISEMGENIIGTSRKISEQPYAGVLFKSQNASTWSPDQNQDLTFKINRANFTINATAEAVFEDGTSAAEYKADIIQIVPAEVVINNTAIGWGVKLTPVGSAILDTSFANIIQNTNYKLPAQRRITTSAGSYSAKATFTSTSAFISPIIDTQRNSVITIENIINNISTNETDAEGGNATARYITRRVNLKDGFDATDLTVFMTSNRQAGSTVQIYYKVLSQFDPGQFDDKPWILMSETTNTNTVSKTEDLGEYLELEFSPVAANTNYTSNSITYDSFKTFAIKIVMLSADTTKVPLIKDLRIIALA